MLSYAIRCPSAKQRREYRVENRFQKGDVQEVRYEGFYCILNVGDPPGSTLMFSSNAKFTLNRTVKLYVVRIYLMDNVFDRCLHCPLTPMAAE